MNTGKTVGVLILMSSLAFAATPLSSMASPSGSAASIESSPLSSVFDSELASGVAFADSTPGSHSYALPQLVFGGGWYTAIYVSNPTTSAVTATVEFYAADGSDLSVPVIGMGPVSDVTVNLNPNSTSIIEAPNSGSLLQGWAEVKLPEGATGYGVFRQSIQGRADQEAVIPLSDDSKSSGTLVWDDTGFTTAVALANPTDSAETVSFTVFRDDGVQIGTATVNLPAKGKTALNLRDLPGMSGVTGRRGLAKFSVSSGAVSVLGLRFGGEAFTSIPVQYQ
jgi:hypothetical protein